MQRKRENVYPISGNTPVVCVFAALAMVLILGSLNEVSGQSEILKERNPRWIINDLLTQGWKLSHNENQIQVKTVPLPVLKRVKRNKDRQNNMETESEDSEEGDDDDERCVRIPPKPPTVSSPSVSINLMTLLNDGSDYMTEDDSIKEAILLLGNTGAGKTTVTQIIAGDTSRVHAVLTQGGDLVIIDDDNRIGAPTTISKTLVPELVIKRNWKMDGADEDDDVDYLNRTAFYDCPGFDDTRGPEEDIAANFFMNQIVRRVTHVKMLFLVIHSSVKAGHDRLDFDLLVSHATKFLKDIPNYRKSIGLVVTKVDSYNHRGKFIAGSVIKNGIVEFLQNYNLTLHSQLESASNQIPKNELKRKLQFVEAILEKDEMGQYDRITFSRSPTKCGQLSKSKMIDKTKNRIIQLYSNALEYSPVDWRDFGYTLKDKTKLTLRNYVTSLNEQVTKGISLLMNDFIKWQERRYLQTVDIAMITSQLQSSAEEIQEMATFLNNLGNLTNPQEIMDILKPALESLNYSIPIKVEKYMRQQQAYFEWFDEVNAGPVMRSKRVWLNPLEMVKDELKNLREWYEFCSDLHTRVGAYSWQLNKPEMPRDGVDWLDFLERETQIPIRSGIRLLASILDRVHLKVLGKIMRFAMRPMEVKCEEEHATITGNYVRLTEFISKSWPLLSHCETEVRQIEIYAAHTIFIDEDVEAEGEELNLVMIAPNWVVIGGDKHVNLNGSPAPPHPVNRAVDGEALAGKPGGPGGSFFGLFLHARDIGKLKITSIGGQGGNGQDGRNGMNGTTNKSPSYEDAPRYESWNFIVYQYSKYRHEGYPGHSGVNGGNGGAAGEGGQPGKIIAFTDGTLPKQFQTITDFGGPGEPGLGGEGGVGARQSEGIHCEKTQWLFGLLGESRQCEKRRYKYGLSSNGRHGEPGNSITGFVSSRSPVYSIVEWKSILNFKFSVDPSIGHNETDAFVQFLNRSPNSVQYFGVQAFVAELEKISELNLESLLPSYISRVEIYAKENWRNIRPANRKVIAYLLASAYSKLVASDQNQGMGMVVDLGHFFNVVRKHMEKLKESSALTEIEEEKAKFGKDIQWRIAEAKRFRDEVVTPAVHKAEAEVHTQLGILGEEFEKLILDSERNLDVSKNRLMIGIQEEEKLKFKQVMGLVGTILTFTDMIGGALNFAGEGLPIIWDSAVEVYNDFKTFFGNSGEIVSGGGNDLRQILESGENLLKGAVHLTRSIKEVLNETEGVTNDNGNQTDFTAAISHLGEEIVSKLLHKSGGDTEKISRLNQLVRESEEKLKDVHNRKAVVEKSFIPLVETLVGSLEWMMAELQNKSESSTVHKPELGIRKWQVARVLRDAKGQLDMLGKGIETTAFTNAIDRVQDSLTMQIGLIEDIVKYEETRKLAEYVAVVNSASLKNIHVRDASLSSSVAKMEKAIVDNSFRKEYHKVLHAFKQWVFPFARLHLTNDLQIKNTLPEMDGDAYMKQVEALQLQWERYRGSTLSAHDTHLIHTNFSSSHRSSSPFFVWRNEKWSQEIHDLFAGKPVHLKADVRLSPKGKDAVKFKLIEINCKIPVGIQSQRENQQSLNSELENFAVVMTHSGVSYYRFQGRYYVMTGANQTIRYNFERDHGNRLGTNRVYMKFKNGDYLLSPYTLWTIQLVTTSSHLNFQRLERFAPYVDLELVGAGIYVDGQRLGGEVMEVEKYYVTDDSIREDIYL